MTLFANTAEGGTNGATLTAGTSGGSNGDAFSVVTPGSAGAITWETAAVYHGTLGYSFQQATSTNACLVAFTDSTPATSFAARCYIYITNMPDVTVQFPIKIRSGANVALAILNMNSDGTIFLTAGTSTGSNSAVALSGTTWYRVELTGTGFNSAATAMTANVYDGDTSTVVATATLSGATTADTVGIIWFGKANGLSTVQWYVDDIACNIGTSTELGVPDIVYTLNESIGTTDIGQQIDLEIDADDAVGVTDSITSTLTAAPVVQQFGVRTEILVGSSWVDVTNVTRLADGVQIKRGRGSEWGSVSPSSLSCTLDNRDNRFAVRNPASPFYGLVGRNTQVRVSAAGVNARLIIAGTGACAKALDTSGLSVTGDLDLRLDVNLSRWDGETSSSYADLMGKWQTVTASGSTFVAADQRSYWLGVNSSACLVLQWSTNGNGTTGLHTVTSTVPVPWPWTGRKAVRAALDVDNGASGNTVTFYTSTTLAGSWTQLGDPVVAAGTTSIYDSTAPVAIGNVDEWNETPNAVYAEVYGAEIRAGATVVANPDFTAQNVGTDAFADGTGVTWSMATVDGGTLARIDNRRYRFWGEVSSWASRWNLAGTDVRLPIDGSGILRRLQQGTPPVRSVMRRSCTGRTQAPYAYWPCEDGKSATNFASVGPRINSGTWDIPPMVFSGAVPTLASYADFPCSLPLPLVKSSRWFGKIATGHLLPGGGGSFSSTGPPHVLRFLCHVPSGAITGTQSLVLMWTAISTLPYWEVLWNAGQFELRGSDGTLASVFTAGPSGADYTDKNVRVSLYLSQSGSDIAYSLNAQVVGEATETVIVSGTRTSQIIGGASELWINYYEASLGDTSLGHFIVDSFLPVAGTDSAAQITNEVNSWADEPAGHRIRRVCAQEGINFVGIGNLSRTRLMGPQRIADLSSLLSDCEAVDGGQLYEPRELFGLGYVVREAEQMRPTTVTLSHISGEADITPVEDDRLVRNSVSVTRQDGSNFSREITSGPMSTAEPPAGIGIYEDSVTLGNATDSELPDHVGWRLHVGTVNEPRYPTTACQLARPVFVNDTTLTENVTRLDMGHVVTITNLPAWLPPGDIVQVVQGVEETLTDATWTISVNTVPESPYHTGVYETARYSSEGSVVGTYCGPTDTTLQVLTAHVIKWSHGDGDFDIFVGGERMTVTAIVDTFPPPFNSQEFTVTRGVNGVARAHEYGEDVELYQPAYWSL
jgi:hypothetical protein